MRLLDVVAAPWAIQPPMLDEIRRVYFSHIAGDKIDIKAVEAKLGRPLNNSKHALEIVDGVAVITAEGVLAKRANLFMDISGGTSMQVLGDQIRTAAADPNVRGIVLNIDSPGGTVDGTQEVAGIIRGVRGKKPIVAVGDGVMASAAYWIASAADQVFAASDTTIVGSIGVVGKHVDESAAEAKAGIKTTEIVAGTYKRIASSKAPLTAEGQAYLQAQVDYLYSIFVDAVAENRGVSVETVLQNMADGRTFIGRQAQIAGLVDGIATLEQVVADVAAGRIRASNPSKGAPGASASTEEEHMELTVEKLKAEFPAIAEAMLAEGRTLGATAERDRIKSVEDAALPGHDALIATLKFDGKTSGGDAALQVNKAERAKRGDKLVQLRNDAGDAGKVPAAQPQDAPTAPDASAPIEERAKAAWDKDAKLRAEFGDDFKSYLAYAKANEGGKVRILAPRAAAAA